MEPEPYSISVDLAAARLRIVINGFWGPEVIARFLAELKEKGEPLEHIGRPYRSLTDARDFRVQSVEIASYFAGFMSTEVGPGLEKQALVVGSALAKLQALRVLEGTAMGIFDSVDAAEIWLES